MEECYYQKSCYFSSSLVLNFWFDFFNVMIGTNNYHS